MDMQNIMLMGLYDQEGWGAQPRLFVENSAGNYYASTSLVIGGVYDSLALEAIAFREALSLAQDLHL